MVTPSNHHFMKPMLHGFETAITIPLQYYAKHIEGKTNLTTWKLRSDVSERTWEVQVDGRTISRGWKDFARAHDLRVSDVVLFKLEGEMVFHVTPFGPSCCEIQYTPPQITDVDDVNEIGGTGTMSYDYCFRAEVTASNVQQDKLCLPVAATSCKALSKQCQQTILVSKDGKSWTANLRFSESGGYYYITKGWSNLCAHKGCAIGDLFVFNVVGDEKISSLVCEVPLMVEEILRKWKKIKSGESFVFDLGSLVGWINILVLSSFWHVACACLASLLAKEFKWFDLTGCTASLFSCFVVFVLYYEPMLCSDCVTGKCSVLYHSTLVSVTGLCMLHFIKYVAFL